MPECVLPDSGGVFKAVEEFPQVECGWNRYGVSRLGHVLDHARVVVAVPEDLFVPALFQQRKLVFLGQI